MFFKRLSAAVLLLVTMALGAVLLSPATTPRQAHAQNSSRIIVVDMGCPTSVSAGNPIRIPNATGINILTGGTFVATVKLEAANVPGTPAAADWTPYGAHAVTGLPTTTAAGAYTFYGDAPPLWLRCNTTIYTSGTPLMRLAQHL